MTGSSLVLRNCINFEKFGRKLLNFFWEDVSKGFVNCQCSFDFDTTTLLFYVSSYNFSEDISMSNLASKHIFFCEELAIGNLNWIQHGRNGSASTFCSAFRSPIIHESLVSRKYRVYIPKRPLFRFTILANL